MLLSLLGLACAETTNIHGLRVSSDSGSARLVFDLNKASDHKLFMLSNPDRMVLDIENASLDKDITSTTFNHLPIQRCRTAKKRNNVIRVVFDLDSPLKAKSFLLPKNDQGVSRLVIDLDYKPKHPVPEKKVAASIENVQKVKRDLIIAIDAGHGGEDPGAVGVNRMHEKRVVYAISKKLAKYFEARKGYQPIMIRTGDYFIPLAERRNIAKQKNADVFISIHADSFTKKKAHGASVFTLSTKGASSASAKFLAERENKADLVGGVSLADKDDVLSSVLVDLSMTYKMESSVDVAEEVLSELGKVTTLHGNRVEHAAFSVLKSLDIPSILVETGFMSNPKEAKNLSSSRFQSKIARAIFNGVDNYFKKKAPEDTYIASAFRHNRAVIYVVERGDTLSQIAMKYDVHLDQLMEFNRLQTKNLAIGQTLQIPINN
ncbi:MAG: N-acetylmuramoyl-L-alanine amidase [Cellvibrionales bacterium]|nr:N-acetylmuramoyl-L-alanine amidase [Cellvibrionales bacterium]